MPSFSYDLRFLQAGADIIEDFLFSPDVYWPAGVQSPAGDPPYPQITLGNLALARTRAAANAHTFEEKLQLERALERIDQARQQWRAAWGKKASQEIRSRLTQWRNFLEEYREHPQSNYDRYTYEVFRRVVIQLLAPDADALSKVDQEMIDGLDGLLKAVLQADNFIWDPEIQPVFPKTTYWYLYGLLSKQGGDRKN